MSQDHRLQRQRFELKYFVKEERTAGIRDFVSSYLELDDYGADSTDHTYPVHSLYLDSADLKTYQASVNGVKNRFKLRLRYYDEKPNTPVFFEVKARVDNCILKQRCGVRRAAVPMLLAGHLPEPKQLLSTEPRHLAALQQFNALQQQLQALPKAHVSYSREAWVSHNDNSVRVTFDRAVHIEPAFAFHATTATSHPVPVFGGPVVLEIKFTSRFPNWLEEMVRCFHLMRGSASKYAEGILRLGEFRFHDGERACGRLDSAAREPAFFDPDQTDRPQTSNRRPASPDADPAVEDLLVKKS